ncbi:MAG TPA: hypothetical protein PKJ51_08845 [Methanothrix sp.]|jgi:hypothetical protein|nr:hypothetical protein [Methanothrix sp.]
MKKRKNRKYLTISPWKLTKKEIVPGEERLEVRGPPFSDPRVSPGS